MTSVMSSPAASYVAAKSALGVVASIVNERVAVPVFRTATVRLRCIGGATETGRRSWTAVPLTTP
jgi:hypothetical protein